MSKTIDTMNRIKGMLAALGSTELEATVDEWISREVRRSSFKAMAEKSRDGIEKAKSTGGIEAFEAWQDGRPVFEMNSRQIWLSAWQASRNVALEEAAKSCDELDNYKCHSSKRPTPGQCAYTIRAL